VTKYLQCATYGVYNAGLNSLVLKEVILNWVEQSKQMLVESGLSDAQVSRDTGLACKFIERVRNRDDYEPGSIKLEILHSYLKAQTMIAKRAS